MLSEDEQIEINMNATSALRSEEDPANTDTPPLSRPQPPPPPPPPPDPPDPQDAKVTEMANEYYLEVIAAFDIHRMVPLIDRNRPKKFPLIPENREKLRAMNRALEQLMTERDFDLTELNTLHYTVATTMAGTIIAKSATPTTQTDPDACTKKRSKQPGKQFGGL